MLKKYRFNSLFIKYFRILIITIFIPSLICCIAIFFAYNQQISSKRKFETDQAKTAVAKNFDSIISEANSAYTKIISNHSIMSFLYSDSYTPSKTLSDTSPIFDTLSSLMLFSPELDSIYLYNPRQGYVISTLSSSFFDDFFDTEWYDTVSSSENVCTAMSRTVSKAGQLAEYLSFIFKYSEQSHDYGYIVINMSYDSLIASMLDTNSSIEELIIFDKEQNILLGSDSSASAAVLSDTGLDGFSIQPIEHSGYSVAVRLSTEIYDIQLKNYALIFICLLIFVILTSIIVAYLISTQFYKMTFSVMHLLSENDTPQAAESGEYEYITKNIYRLYQNQHRYEEKLSTSIAALKKLQLNILQEQISPHFIYNTLNLISLIDIKEHKTDGKISQIVRLLSDILHSVIDTDSYLVTLDEELAYLDKYSRIQNIKYEDIFEFEYRTEDNTRSLRVVKFMLQPIVENAISHGILKAPEGRGKIVIASHIKEDTLYITVTDSGVGFEPERLEEIRAQLKSDSITPREHIGLLNVNNRIKLVFGIQYGLDITSEYGKTTVTYRLPIKDN